MDYRKHHFDLKDSTYGISLFTPPEKNTQKPPLLLLPGEFRTYRSYLEIIKLFMESGRVVMSPYFPTRKHKNKYGKESSSIAFDLPLIFSIRRAFLLKAVITLQEIYCFEKVDVLAHSSGCIPAVFAGLECGDLFGNFVFDSLPAVTGKESRWQITMRAMRNARQMKKEGRRYADDIDFIDFLQRSLHAENDMKNVMGLYSFCQKPQAMLDGMLPGMMDIREHVKNLAVSGHKVSVIVNGDDMMIPHDKMLRVFADAGRHPQPPF